MKAPRKSVWVVSLILALGFVVNYIDRANLSVAAPLIRREFGFDATQLGFLFSSFFASYALMQVPAGFLVDRFSLKWLYAGAFVLWSLSNAAVALAGGFLSIMLLRILLSVGESISLPASSKILAREFREDQRGIANGIVDSGYKFGPALGTAFGGVFVAQYGWRPLFIVTGLVGILWLIPWFWVAGSAAPAERPRADLGSEAVLPLALSVKQILASPRAWGTFAGNFCGGYVWYLMLTWLPSYLVTERGMPLAKMGVYGSLLFTATGVTSIATGLVTDRLIRDGWSASKVRIRFAVCGLLLSILLVPAGLASSSRQALLWLTLACAFFGFYSSNVWAISQAIAGPRNIGRWSGIQNLIGNLGGVASPALTGWIVTVTGSFRGAFLVAAAVLLLGALTYITVVRSLDPIPEAVLPTAPRGSIPVLKDQPEFRGKV
jgi:MFS family permease